MLSRPPGILAPGGAPYREGVLFVICVDRDNEGIAAPGGT
jgi:hypothetical protein